MKIKNNIKQIAFIVVIIATVLFIWSRSFTFADESTSQSNWVKQLLIDFFNIFNIKIETTFFFKNIRKFAHFAEFFVLGCELMLYRYCYLREKKFSVAVSFLSGLAVAFLDEAIQLIPALERDGKITDVGIDALGVASGFGLVFVICTLICKIKAKSSLHSN